MKGIGVWRKSSKSAVKLCVVSQEAGDRVMMKTEWSFVNGSFRIHRNDIQVHLKRLTINILRRVQFTKSELHRSRVDQCDFPVVVKLYYLYIWV